MEFSSTEALVLFVLVFLPAGVASTTYRNLSGARAPSDREYRVVSLLAWSSICATWVFPLWGRLSWALTHAQQARATLGEGVLLFSVLIGAPYFSGLFSGKLGMTARGRVVLRTMGLVSWREHSVWEDVLVGPEHIWHEFRDNGCHYEGLVTQAGANTVAVTRIRRIARQLPDGSYEKEFATELLRPNDHAVIHEDGRVSWFYIYPDQPRRTWLTPERAFWSLSWVAFGVVLGAGYGLPGLVLVIFSAGVHFAYWFTARPSVRPPQDW